MPHRPIIEALERARSLEGQAVAVFDLDSTLFNTGARSGVILEEFAETYPGFRQYLGGFDPLSMGWELTDELRALGCDDEEGLSALQRFWRERFFTDDYVVHDTVYPGALDVVHRAHDAGMLPYYLTGRDVPNMKRGTLTALDQAGFPMPPERARLRMKPNYSESDLIFKARVIEELRQLGEVLLVMENEPPNANLFAEHFPEAVVVLHDTVCAPNPPPLHGSVIRVPHLEVPW